MSILAYVGLPGSGKTYGVVQNQIVPALKEKRTVVTNVPLHMAKVLEQYPDADIREFPTDAVAQQPELIDEYAPAGCVLIIDELWKLFPAGQKVNHVPAPFKRLLAEHRHMVDEQGRSTQIVFVTQDLAQIGAFARQLVEQTFLHTKLGHLGASGSYRVRIFHGQVTGQSPPKQSEINMFLGRYDAKVYGLYQSHTMRKGEGSGADEKSVDSRGNVWKRPGLIVAGIVCVVVIVWAVPTLGHQFKRGDAPAVASVATNGPAQSRIVPSVPARRSATTVDTATAHAAPVTWRVSGLLDIGEDSIALLSSSDGQTAITPVRDCLRSRWNTECKFRGQWVRFEAAKIVPESSPVAPQVPHLID